MLTTLAHAAKAYWGYAPETMRQWEGLLGVDASAIATQPVYVAEVGGTAAGFYALKHLRGRKWELDQLWVSPAFMRRGLGRALVAHALEHAARAGAATLVVDADPNAEAFYLACGATRTGELAAPIPGAPERVRPQLVFRHLAPGPA